MKGSRSRQRTKTCFDGVRRVVLFCAALWGCAAAAPAEDVAPDEDLINPDRPGIADGSSVVGSGRFQIETGLQFEWRDLGLVSERTLFLPTLLRIGIGDRLEARVESNTYTRVRDSASGTELATTDGLAPVSIGLKAHFQESQGSHRPSLGAILRVFPPSGSGDFHTHRVTADLRLAADWDLASKWSLNPNAGIAVYEDDSGRFSAALFALTVTYTPRKAVSFFVDEALQAPEASHAHTAVIYDLGAALVLGRNVQLDLSAGEGAAGATPPHPFVAAGFSRRF